MISLRRYTKYRASLHEAAVRCCRDLAEESQHLTKSVPQITDPLRATTMDSVRPQFPEEQRGNPRCWHRGFWPLALHFYWGGGVRRLPVEIVFGTGGVLGTAVALLGYYLITMPLVIFQMLRGQMKQATCANVWAHKLRLYRGLGLLIGIITMIRCVTMINRGGVQGVYFVTVPSNARWMISSVERRQCATLTPGEECLQVPYCIIADIRCTTNALAYAQHYYHANILRLIKNYNYSLTQPYNGTLLKHRLDNILGTHQRERTFSDAADEVLDVINAGTPVKVDPFESSGAKYNYRLALAIVAHLIIVLAFTQIELRAFERVCAYILFGTLACNLLMLISSWETLKDSFFRRPSTDYYFAPRAFYRLLVPALADSLAATNINYYLGSRFARPNNSVNNAAPATDRELLAAESAALVRNKPASQQGLSADLHPEASTSLTKGQFANVTWGGIFTQTPNQAMSLNVAKLAARLAFVLRILSLLVAAAAFGLIQKHENSIERNSPDVSFGHDSFSYSMAASTFALQLVILSATGSMYAGNGLLMGHFMTQFLTNAAFSALACASVAAFLTEVHSSVVGADETPDQEEELNGEGLKRKDTYTNAIIQPPRLDEIHKRHEKIRRREQRIAAVVTVLLHLVALGFPYIYGRWSGGIVLFEFEKGLELLIVPMVVLIITLFYGLSDRSSLVPSQWWTTFFALFLIMGSAVMAVFSGHVKHNLPFRITSLLLFGLCLVHLGLQNLRSRRVGAPFDELSVFEKIRRKYNCLFHNFGRYRLKRGTFSLPLQVLIPGLCVFQLLDLFVNQRRWTAAGLAGVVDSARYYVGRAGYTVLGDRSAMWFGGPAKSLQQLVSPVIAYAMLGFAGAILVTGALLIRQEWTQDDDLNADDNERLKTYWKNLYDTPLLCRPALTLRDWFCRSPHALWASTHQYKIHNRY